MGNIREMSAKDTGTTPHAKHRVVLSVMIRKPPAHYNYELFSTNVVKTLMLEIT